MRVVVGIATMKGREPYLKKAVDSLKDQAEVMVYDNQVRPIDYADNGKFFFLKQIKEPVYYLSCDDDIIYPPTYVVDMVAAIDRYGIVTHHGRILKGLNRNYYRGHQAFRCNHEIKEAKTIHVAGTGVTGFRTDQFNPVDIYRSKYKRMADLVFSLEAAKKGKSITVLPHPVDYFTIQDVPRDQTIYGMEVDRDTGQMELANAIYELRHL